MSLDVDSVECVDRSLLVNVVSDMASYVGGPLDVCVEMSAISASVSMAFSRGCDELGALAVPESDDADWEGPFLTYDPDSYIRSGRTLISRVLRESVLRRLPQHSTLKDLESLAIEAALAYVAGCKTLICLEAEPAVPV